MTTIPNSPAALAEQPVKPTDEELLRTYGVAKRDHCYDGPFHNWARRAERAATIHGLRAVLARWGTPAIQPVPVSERLPGPEDLDSEGLCWWWSRDITAWCLCFAYLVADGDSSEWTHWLPHWALPVPTPVNTNQEDT
jgi:hypothetical protein